MIPYAELNGVTIGADVIDRLPAAEGNFYGL